MPVVEVVVFTAALRAPVVQAVAERAARRVQMAPQVLQTVAVVVAVPVLGHLVMPVARAAQALL